MKTSQPDATHDALDDSREREFSGASRIIWLTGILCLILAVWAWFGILDEVSTGTGKVIPSSREQVLQSLDGGILAELMVHEGDQVQAGQVLARLDPTRSESNVGESAAAIAPRWPPVSALTAEVSDQAAGLL